MNIASKKMRYIFLVTAFVMLSGAAVARLLPNTETVKTAPSAVLPVIFSETGADFEKIMLRDDDVLDRCSHTCEELRSLTAMLPRALGDCGGLQFTEYSGEGCCGISISGTTDRGYALDLVVQSREKAGETLLLTELWCDDGIGALPGLLQYNDGCFEALGVVGNPAVVLAGTYRKILSPREKAKIAQRCFGVFRGKVSEKAVDGDYLSYSGYVPGLGRGIFS